MPSWADLAQVLDESELYDKAGFSGFQAFAARCLRLRELALSLRELCTQLREERRPCWPSARPRP